MPRTPAADAPPRQFNLISWFSVSGTLVIVLTSVIISYVLAAFLDEHLLRRDAVVMKDFVERIAQHHDPRGYFAQPYPGGGATLNDFFEDISHMPDVARINAFAPDGRVVWSSDAAMIGSRFPDNEELTEALTGELVYEKGWLDTVAKPEHLPFRQQVDWFVENYIPIRDNLGGQIVGVVEIYRIPAALSRSIEEGRRLVWTTVSAGGLLLFISLFWVVWRGQRLIRAQQSELVRHTRLAAIGEMASSVAHSIRNPIASIRSSAELALDSLQEADVAESLDDIISEVDRFDGWIRELLTFTSEAGDPDAVTELGSVVANSLAGFAKHASRNNVEIRNRVPTGLPLVRGDNALLTQVINSLAANSLDAMPHGGSLTIDAVTGNTSARISIVDSGFGIPPERLQGLFDPLVTHKNGGLGIGLALARQIIQRYGGSIDVSSAVGSGTTVVVELPFQGH